MKMTRRNFLSASALTLLSCQLAPAARADCLLSGLFHGADTALPPKPLTAKVVDANPFMGRSESNIHHDCYNTDSTDAVLPVGICPEVNVAMEKTNPNASPAIFFDNFDIYGLRVHCQTVVKQRCGRSVHCRYRPESLPGFFSFLQYIRYHGNPDICL